MQGMSLLDPNGLFSPFGRVIAESDETTAESGETTATADTGGGQTNFVLVGKWKTKEKWRKEAVCAGLTEAKRLTTTLMGGEQIDLYVHAADDTPLAMKLWGYKWRDIRNGPVKRPGKQRDETSERWCITMPKAFADIATRLGDGSISKGIRIAIAAYREQSEREEREERDEDI